MNRAQRTLIKILRAYLHQGQDMVARKSLRGNPFRKSKCLEKAQRYLALVRQHNGARQWQRGVLDSTISDARKIAESVKCDCELRMKNVEYLMQAEGILSATDDPTSKYIASLVTPAKAAPCAQRPAQAAPSTQQHADLVNEFRSLGRG